MPYSRLFFGIPPPYLPHPRGRDPRGSLGGEFDLGVADVPKDAYKANIEWINMRWLWNSLVNEEYGGKVYCPTT